MKSRYLLVFAALLLNACGEGKAPKLTPDETPEIEEFSKVTFPRTFFAQAQYKDDLGVTLEASSYVPSNSRAVFGCLISGSDFTMVMKNGQSDLLRIKMRGINVRESKTTYMNLVDISLDGRSPAGGFLFDSVAAGSEMQVESCDLVLQRASPSLAGQLSCRNVTSQRLTEQRLKRQADLTVDFSCDIVH